MLKKKIGKIATFNMNLATEIVEWSPEITQILERELDEFENTSEGY